MSKRLWEGRGGGIHTSKIWHQILILSIIQSCWNLILKKAHFYRGSLLIISSLETLYPSKKFRKKLLKIIMEVNAQSLKGDCYNRRHFSFFSLAKFKKQCETEYKIPERKSSAKRSFSRYPSRLCQYPRHWKTLIYAFISYSNHKEKPSLVSKSLLQMLWWTCRAEEQMLGLIRSHVILLTPEEKATCTIEIKST